MGKTVRADIYAEKQSRPKDLLWQKRVYKKDDMREFLKLCNMLDKAGRTKPEHGGSGGGRRSWARDARQNCVVKCRIGKEKAAHLRFIAEYMPQKNKLQVEEKPELFSGEIVDAAFIEKYKERMAGKHFKFIISPENQNVDAQALVKTLVKRMEAATGYRFSWLAAVHTDTAHKHAHLLINGTDKTGRDIVLDKPFIKGTMREMCRSICTEMLGKRTREEMRAEELKTCKAYRFCTLDKGLQQYERRVYLPVERYGSEVIVTDMLLKNRLEHLVMLGLAARKPGKNGGNGRNEKNAYYLEKGWAEKLRVMGRYNSFLKARGEMRWTAAGDIILYDKTCGAITGTVTKLYRMNDEDSWNHAIVVENKELGRAWYVPLYYEPKRELLNAEITCEMKENQRGLLTPVLSKGAGTQRKTKPAFGR